MAYFRDTNIDEEFGKPKKKLFNIKKNKSSNDKDDSGRKSFVFVIGGIVLLLVIAILGIILFNKDSGYYIILEGDSEITIYEETDYVELGYHGYDKKGNEITHLVNVDNTVNTSVVGKYEVTYSLKDAIVKRYVNVIDKGVGDTYINLSGDVEIYLKLGENYTEPGYLAFDTVDGDLTSKVVVNNNVNTSKSGNYKIVYSVVNEAGVTTSITRTVIVVGADISLTLSNSNKTTGSVNINIIVNDNYFSYMVLPNGSKVSENTYSYKVSSNGTYKFTSYDKFGNKTEKSITVSNIEVITNNNTGNNGSNNNVDKNNGSNTSSNNSNNNSSSNNVSNSTSQNNQNTQTVKIDMPKVYASDNIDSGKKHSVGFLVKLTGDNTIYYCLDSNNTCNPNTKYTEQLRFASSQQKYLRYKACNSSNQCSSIGSYHVNLSITNKNPSNSTSGGKANPHQAAFYRQDDGRWGSSSMPISPYRSIASAGCGYTSLAMIITGLTHDYSVTPKKVINVLESSGKRYYYKESDCSGCGGMMYYYASYNSTLMSKYNYDTSELFNNWNSTSSDDSKSYKIEAISESLKMGHLILILVPNHYIALVGMDSEEQVYIFNPAGDAWKSSVSYLYSYYYDYKSRCSNNGDCGLQIGYEFYPEDGMSLKEWRAIS